MTTSPKKREAVRLNDHQGATETSSLITETVFDSVMESSVETSQTGGASKPKPSLAPKPRLAPKPFSLQKNTAIRSINAPKPASTTSKPASNQTGNSGAPGVPKPTPATRAPKPRQQTTTYASKPCSASVHTKDKPETTKESKESPHKEDTLSSSVAPGKSDPAPQTAPPKSEPVQKDDVIQTNHKASTDFVTNSEQKDGKKTEDETQTPVIQKPEESGSDTSSTANPTYRWGSTRRSLPAELTSKFESGGQPQPPKITATAPTSNTKDHSKKPVSTPEPSQTTTEPSNRESDEGQPKEEDYSGGGSIKRRISLLFDSSQRPEVTPKREEPEIINATGGVKERIKHWASETSSEGPKTEKKPRVAPRPRSWSFEPVTEETPKTPHVDPPASGTSSTQDPGSKVSPAEALSQSPVETSKDVPPEKENISTEEPREDKQPKSTEDEVPPHDRSTSPTQATSKEGDAASSEKALKRNTVKRRSVRFGVVERDDGGPPVILGPTSDSEDEEKKEGTPQDKADEDASAQKDEEEGLKHLEFEEKRKEEENERARLKLEEEQKHEEEKKEKEKARLEEELRVKQEEERERARLKEEEMERQQKEEWERERLKEEEKERQRLKEEEMERERQMQLMLQKQREEESKRAKQKEERLKQDQKEREEERVKDEKPKEEEEEEGGV
ncbi:hypothetical protein INR49_012545 [Caranx melampygus]|nr:hypothetical protein INR49_012545 [Caranx melampygus]